MIDNRKSSSVGFFLFFAVLLLASILVIVYGTNEKKSLLYSAEYVAREQEETIDVQYFEMNGEAFSIGANSQGKPVFKDPEAALEALKADYQTGVNLIKEEFKLAELTDKSYKEYLRKGKKISNGSENARMQADFVVKFLEVYDNSFADDYNIKLPY
ncbi:MAG: hypothetical protein K6G88_15440 [Lachnospiraceae bacterium]|nr:hypothetical protein [Lachnospiraceae bacterium]